MVYIYDLEVYPNLFVATFKNTKEDTFLNFIVWEVDGEYKIDDREKLFIFLSKNHKLAGYNNLNYDSQILEYILFHRGFTPADLKDKSNRLINKEEDIIWESKLSTKQLDLYRIWHYNNNARSTSLKWLEFMLKVRSIKDLPYEHDKIITLNSQVEKIVKYCEHDVKITEQFFEISLPRIKHRLAVTKKFGVDMMNKSDSSMGEAIIFHILSRELGISEWELKKGRTNRRSIDLSDVTFEYPSYPLLDKVKSEYFETIHLVSKTNHETGNKIFDLKSVPVYEISWKGIDIVYGMGGIHGCVPKGVYSSDSEYVIKSCDVTAEYPNIIIQNNIYPKHIGPKFNKIYKDHIVNERKNWPKDTHYMFNMMYKLASNSAYGKLKSDFSGLYDPLCALTITINGQLSKTLLAEMLVEAIPDSQILMMNTDGLEIMIPRKDENKYMEVCKKWENFTKLELEHEDYKKLIIDSVNHYIGIFSNGSVKRKGRFYIDEDYSKYEEYHKNASSTIISEAIFEYFYSDTPVEDTIMQCDDIYKFLIGSKKQKGFVFVLLKADDNRNVSFKKYSDRVLRYYMCKEPVGSKYKSGSLYKLWNDGRLTGLQKNGLVKIVQSLRSIDIKKYPDIDYEYYINEAYKIIDPIEGVEKI